MELTIGADSVRRVRWEGAVLALLAVVVPVFCGHALAQVEQEWAAFYNGPGNSTDDATAMAVDAAGNVYVTGASIGADASADYATVKYDANGNELWVARYNNSAGNSMGQAGFIAVDGSGNVYVSGLSIVSYFPEGYAMVKYDGSGNELWVARLEYFSSGHTAVALDAAGNVYFTGVGYGLGTTGTGYATFKYDGSGNEVWRADYRCGYHSGGTGLSLDAAGNVYVTGYCRVSDTIPEGYATVNYDSSGNELWTARYERPNPSHAVLALDAAGDVYVTGVGEGSGTSSDYATVKYDANGDELWAARYSGPENPESSWAAIALDAAGNVYVTGTSGGDYATIKMVSSGFTDGGGDGSGGGGGCFLTAAAN